MTNKIDISQIFSGFGVPKSTYVAQENGVYEKQLIRGVMEDGTLCLITGSSKTGKTTLQNKVLSQLDRSPLLIRCDATIDANEFWKRPLEAVDFNRLKETHRGHSVETQATGKIGGKIGWQWLAELIGEVSLGLKGKREETEIREAILAQPCPNHLIPLLKKSNAILVVEDFHYLDNNIQKQVFQQWKVFTDEGISVIVVGTTHHGVDLAYGNPDLVGRIQQIDLKRWSDDDLEQIVKKGFTELQISISQLAINILAKESAGLPIITQQSAAQLFLDKGISEVQVGLEIFFTDQDSYNALYNVAVSRYKQFESWYTRLTTGPRKAARKYNTYELILSAFTLDPLQFSLKRYEIDERIAQMPIDKSHKPPPASLTSTLSALGRFQQKNGFELLEWSKRDQAIYVLEPAFLFYLRWREKQVRPPAIIDTLLKLLNPSVREGVLATANFLSRKLD